ncbi:MAG: thiamine-phosphate kinase [Elusimicrobia bacterium]|nr:thiamine-phosphate kinase [Elusimicrobiota bacterium]
MREEEIIEFIKRRMVPQQTTVIAGPGDDTAVVSYNRKEYMLLTTDCVVEDIHFTRKEASLYQIAKKAVAVNLSDIAAMGGIPLYALVSAGLPETFTRREIIQLINGLKYMADKFHFDIVGGNLTRSEKLFIDISLTGKVEKQSLKKRSGAKPGDLIFVTGRLGGNRIKKHLSFTPRIKEARKIIKEYSVTAMMDISDGLSTDLTRLAKASNVGFKIYLDKIPLSQDAIKIGGNKGKAIQHALNDGEDYELLFTVSKHNRKKAPKSINGLLLSCIGEIVKEKKYTGISIDNKKTAIQAKGFSHF